MSFGRSKVTRFNEIKGCAPAVGSYDVKDASKVVVNAMTEKSTRFHAVKDASSIAMDASLSKSSSMGELRTPIKANIAMRKKLSSSSTPHHQAENSKIKELEMKIKFLLNQETEMNRRLQQAQEKADKLDGKLQGAIKEKAQLQAQLAKSDKEVQILAKAKEVLRNKVENLQNTTTRHNSTSEELEATKVQLKKKEQELEEVEMKLSTKIHSLQSDLTAAHGTIQALQETKEALEQTNKDMREHGQAVEDEIKQLQDVTDALRLENQFLQDDIDQSEEQKQAMKQDLETARHTLKETEERLQTAATTISSLEENKSDLEKELAKSEASIARLQEQESMLGDQITGLEAQLADLQTRYEEETIRRKAAQDKTEQLREELERTEHSTTESLRQLSDKYQSLEQILAQTEADLAWEGDTHRAQLAAAEAISQQRAEEITVLQIQNRDLIHALNIEKEQYGLLEEQVLDQSEDERMLKDIDDRLNVEEKQCEEMLGIRGDLETRFQELEKELGEVRDQLETSRRKRQEDLDAFQEERTQLTADLQAEKEEADYLKKQLEELGAEMEEEIEEVTGLDERLQTQENEIVGIQSAKEELAAKLEEMKAERMKAADMIGELERAREEDKQRFTQENNRLCDELTKEKERVDSLEVQLKELSEDFEKLTNIENRLLQQEGTVEDIKLDKDRLQSMLKLAENRQISAEVDLEHALSEKRGVEESLTEQQELTASLDSRLKVAQKSKESLTRQVELLDAAKKKLSADLLAGQQALHRLECEATAAKEECSQLRTRYEGVEEKWRAKVDELEGAGDAQRQEFGRRLVETQTQLSAKGAELARSEEDHKAKTAQMRARLEERIDDLEARLKQLQEDTNNHICVDEEAIAAIQQEADCWKMKFEELTAKVEPFQEQLDQFEVERRMLLSQNDAAQSEVNKLSTDFAKLLGHQNQKQKIHHIMKIKEENVKLKKDLNKLREENTKQSRALRQLKDRASRADGHKKFDSSMAFQHDKENKAKPLAQRN